MARGSCETYKEAEQSFINQEKNLRLLIKNKQTTNIRKQIEIKEKAEERLLKLGREILLEKQKYISVVQQVKKEIHLKSKKIGIFAKDMALKNFIHQVVPFCKVHQRLYFDREFLEKIFRVIPVAESQ